MKLPFVLIVFLTICVPLCSKAYAQLEDKHNPLVRQVAADGTVKFEFSERVQHPHFWWPRTLLNYHVVVADSCAAPENWRLTDTTNGQAVAVQVSNVRKENGRILSATVSFIADLPTAGARVFVLDTKQTKVPMVTGPHKRITRDNVGNVLDTGCLKLRFPDSQNCPSGLAVPGPILALDDGHGWVGNAIIDSPKIPVQKLTSEILDDGPLFSRVRLVYEFLGGARYAATLKATVGYDFVELSEEFNGLAPEDNVVFRFSWFGLPLTHRRGMEKIDEPHTIYSRGEDPYFTGQPHVEDPAKQFYFWLGHSAADSTTQVTSVDFSNHKTGRAVGLCVLDGSQWDDGGYSLWASGDTLAVKFRYREETLEWLLPLAGKRRHLGFAAYNLEENTHAQKAMGTWSNPDQTMAMANNGVATDTSRIGFINSRYGGMSLDVVKDWHLEYDDNARNGSPSGIEPASGSTKQLANLQTYLEALWGDNEMLRVEGNWVSPVSLRVMVRWVVAGFDAFRDQMSPEMRARVSALLLFHSYMAAREEISPMRHMLKGHPNFMADWKYPLMAGAYLFPEHPLAAEWADQFEKFVELCGIFHVRPSVTAWESQGGRWTESIGIYNWAYLEPVCRANELGLLFDGKNRIATEAMAQHGDYLVGIASAPVKLGKNGEPFEFTSKTPLVPENGFVRIHPPQGAHASRHAIPECVESFAMAFRNHTPKTAEALLWLKRRPHTDTSASHSLSNQSVGNSAAMGTNPRLQSAKFTGYGTVLRAAVNTPQEISVFLQQIDKGPNYRWGFGNEGGCGDIYYYAGGMSFSGHLGEDAGDRRVNDAELTCNTGVYKDATFRSIGMNDLTEPLINFGSAQFTEILARSGPDAYSWPEYEARSVILVGHDYIIVHDTINNTSRMSWSIVRGQDKFPTIQTIRGDAAYRVSQSVEGGRGQVSETVRFDPYKGHGERDRMTLVSHRSDLKVIAPKKSMSVNVTEVRTPEGSDFVFLQREAFSEDNAEFQFSGKTGLIRAFKDGRKELHLFHGQRIGSTEMQMEVDKPDLAVSAAFHSTADISGKYFSRTGGALTITVPHGMPKGQKFFLNGATTEASIENNTLVVPIPAGAGMWQLTNGPAVPMAPEIISSLARADGASIVFTPVASATEYLIERSDDIGQYWVKIGHSPRTDFTLGGVVAPAHFHLRVTAVNGTCPGEPSVDYPIHVTGKPVGPPDGLRLRLGQEENLVSWGRVQGAQAYVLYRKRVDEKTWTKIYQGADNTFRDSSVRGQVPAYSHPGLLESALRQPMLSPQIYAYAVSSVDGVGESDKSHVATSDPASWRNWYPDTELRFKRRSSYWLPPYVSEDQVPPAFYPK